jgi:hypothetical protein
MRMPTESSVALQIVRFTASHVGSCVFVRACNSTVLKTEQIVTLWIESVRIPSSFKQTTYTSPRQNTILRPHCVRFGN